MEQDGNRPGYAIVYEAKNNKTTNGIDYPKFISDLKKAQCVVASAQNNYCFPIEGDVRITDEELFFVTRNGPTTYAYTNSYKHAPDILPTERVVVDVAVGNENGPFMVFHGGCAFYFTSLADARSLADDFFALQQREVRRYLTGQAEFEALAAKYRALAVKPKVHEEQRMYIVQANTLSKQKQYAQAIEVYRKALDLDQTAYPEAYYNIALLSANDGAFGSAIANMKKYLLLVPDAKDARSAQDKIYEWGVMSKP